MSMMSKDLTLQEILFHDLLHQLQTRSTASIVSCGYLQAIIIEWLALCDIGATVLPFEHFHKHHV
jgi:hypothetical protein